jgi:hypothetical protein
MAYVKLKRLSFSEIYIFNMPYFESFSRFLIGFLQFLQLAIRFYLVYHILQTVLRWLNTVFKKNGKFTI